MHDKNISTLVFSALFAALCCAATMVIRLPTAFGYMNAGDAVVLLGAFLLGPLWGALAAGLGSALADLLSGYVLYAPGTFVIKGAMALLAGWLLTRLGLKRPNPAAVLAGALSEILMVAGYFLYECFVLGYGAGAAADIPTNVVQGVFGAAAGAVLFGALSKTPYIRRMTAGTGSKKQ